MHGVNEETTTDREKRIAEEVLDILDRWSERLSGHHTQKREHARKRFRSPITIYVPEAETVAGECAESTTVQAYSRNISSGGIAFVYPGQLKAEKVIICLDPDGAGSHWFHAEIVRSRQVHRDFWEFGAKFLERAAM